ncbi:MAG: hypothetical protein ABIH18_04420 [Candidatus Omnitrophota bacterium]
MNFKRIILSILFFSIIFPLLNIAMAEDGEPRIPELCVFYSPGCHKCIEVKTKEIPRIEKNFKDRIKVVYYDTSEIENYKLLLFLREKYKAEFKIVFPVFFLSGHFFNGADFGKKSYKKFIIEALKGAVEGENGASKVDLVARFKKIRPLAIISAGLIDGINPCAFTVIVFFISFLALQGYKRAELVIIGLAFIFSVFLTYLLIGLGVFSFFYRMKSFALLTRVFNLSIGVFSIILGVLALYDFFKFKKTGKTEGLLLQLPQAVKKQIHSVIGMHYRKVKEEKARPQYVVRLLASALITGFLVSLLEAVCTGQVYLPTISFVLKTSPLKLQAFSYLLLYNFMFIIPLLAVFIFALFGTTSEQFSKILKGHMLSIKILMAILFFALGIFLIWRV